VRRFYAIALLLLFVLPVIAPLLALGQGIDDTTLPACCRRDGKHNCLLRMNPAMAAFAQRGPSAATVVGERCPYGSHALPSLAHRDWSAETADAIFAGLVAHPATAPQTEARRRISALRSNQKRGPPSLSL
jgi:hypothetical protein